MRFPDLPPLPTSNMRCLTHATLYPHTRQSNTMHTQAYHYTHLHIAPAYTVTHIFATHCIFLCLHDGHSLLQYPVMRFCIIIAIAKARPTPCISPDFAHFLASVVIKCLYFISNHKQIIFFCFQTILFCRRQSNRLSHSGCFNGCEWYQTPFKIGCIRIAFCFTLCLESI